MHITVHFLPAQHIVELGWSYIVVSKVFTRAISDSECAKLAVDVGNIGIVSNTGYIFFDTHQRAEIQATISILLCRPQFRRIYSLHQRIVGDFAAIYSATNFNGKLVAAMTRHYVGTHLCALIAVQVAVYVYFMACIAAL